MSLHTCLHYQLTLLILLISSALLLGVITTNHRLRLRCGRFLRNQRQINLSVAAPQKRVYGAALTTGALAHAG